MTPLTAQITPKTGAKSLQSFPMSLFSAPELKVQPDKHSKHAVAP